MKTKKKQVTDMTHDTSLTQSLEDRHLTEKDTVDSGKESDQATESEANVPQPATSDNDVTKQNIDSAQTKPVKTRRKKKKTRLSPSVDDDDAVNVETGLTGTVHEEYDIDTISKESGHIEDVSEDVEQCSTEEPEIEDQKKKGKRKKRKSKPRDSEELSSHEDEHVGVNVSGGSDIDVSGLTVEYETTEDDRPPKKSKRKKPKKHLLPSEHDLEQLIKTDDETTANFIPEEGDSTDSSKLVPDTEALHYEKEMVKEGEMAFELDSAIDMQKQEKDEHGSCTVVSDVVDSDTELPDESLAASKPKRKRKPKKLHESTDSDEIEPSISDILEDTEEQEVYASDVVPQVPDVVDSDTELAHQSLAASKPKKRKRKPKKFSEIADSDGLEPTTSDILEDTEEQEFDASDVSSENVPQVPDVVESETELPDESLDASKPKKRKRKPKKLDNDEIEPHTRDILKDTEEQDFDASNVSSDLLPQVTPPKMKKRKLRKPKEDVEPEMTLSTDLYGKVSSEEVGGSDSAEEDVVETEFMANFPTESSDELDDVSHPEQVDTTETQLKKKKRKKTTQEPSVDKPTKDTIDQQDTMTQDTSAEETPPVVSADINPSFLLDTHDSTDTTPALEPTETSTDTSSDILSQQDDDTTLSLEKKLKKKKKKLKEAIPAPAGEKDIEISPDTHVEDSITSPKKKTKKKRKQAKEPVDHEEPDISVTYIAKSQVKVELSEPLLHQPDLGREDVIDDIDDDNAEDTIPRDIKLSDEEGVETEKEDMLVPVQFSENDEISASENVREKKKKRKKDVTLLGIGYEAGTELKIADVADGELESSSDQSQDKVLSDSISTVSSSDILEIQTDDAREEVDKNKKSKKSKKKEVRSTSEEEVSHFEEQDQSLEIDDLVEDDTVKTKKKHKKKKSKPAQQLLEDIDTFTSVESEEIIQSIDTDLEAEQITQPDQQLSKTDDATEEVEEKRKIKKKKKVRSPSEEVSPFEDQDQSLEIDGHVEDGTVKMKKKHKTEKNKPTQQLMEDIDTIVGLVESEEIIQVQFIESDSDEQITQPDQQLSDQELLVSDEHPDTIETAIVLADSETTQTMTIGKEVDSERNELDTGEERDISEYESVAQPDISTDMNYKIEEPTLGQSLDSVVSGSIPTVSPSDTPEIKTDYAVEEVGKIRKSKMKKKVRVTSEEVSPSEDQDQSLEVDDHVEDGTVKIKKKKSKLENIDIITSSVESEEIIEVHSIDSDSDAEQIIQPDQQLSDQDLLTSDETPGTIETVMVLVDSETTESMTIGKEVDSDRNEPDTGEGEISAYESDAQPDISTDMDKFRGDEERIGGIDTGEDHIDDTLGQLESDAEYMSTRSLLKKAIEDISTQQPDTEQEQGATSDIERDMVASDYQASDGSVIKETSPDTRDLPHATVSKKKKEKKHKRRPADIDPRQVADAMDEITAKAGQESTPNDEQLEKLPTLDSLPDDELTLDKISFETDTTEPIADITTDINIKTTEKPDRMPTPYVMDEDKDSFESLLPEPGTGLCNQNHFIHYVFC